MRCARCGRLILHPVDIAGAKFGPVCAQKVLVAAGRIAPREKRTPIHDHPSTAQRDEHTRDLFEGVSA